MPKKDDDPNALLILGEASDRKSIFGDSKRVSGSPPTEPAGRFDILPSSGMTHKTERKETKDSGTSAAVLEKQTITSENYQEVYLKNLREDAEKKDAEKKESLPERTAAQKEEEKKQNEQRFRARELQSQIVFWQQQRGQGLYDDGTIDAMIEQIKRELGSIPQGLW